MDPTAAIEADAVWDRWCEARDESPQLSPEAFAERQPGKQREVLELLLALLAVEEQAPLPSLVRVLRPGLDGYQRFATFKLLHEIGEGSAGIVFEAIDQRGSGGHERVALKILNPVLGSGRLQRDSILREAKITQQLEHPSIVRVLGSGTEQGYAWIATELLEGESLASWMDREGNPGLRIVSALDIGVQLAGALVHAHGRGVLHRDLKPANIMIHPSGKAKMLDFGLARREGAAFGVSHTGEVVGTPLYMAPEQLRGAVDLDGRADIYALGLVLLELATGKRLLLRADALKIMAGIARGSGRLSGRYYAGLPGGLAGVLSRCLEPDRRDRYRSAEDLVADLTALREGRRPRLRRLGALAVLANGIARRPLRAAGLALAATLVAYGAFWAAHHVPIPVTINSILVRPTKILVDGEQVPSSMPLTMSFWERGLHQVELFEGPYSYPFEIMVSDEGPRQFELPCGRIYPSPQPLNLGSDPLEPRAVAFVQLGIRAADHSDHHQGLRARVSGLPGLDHAVGGFSTFPLDIREEPYLLHIESDGFRPRDVPILISDGGTRSIMVELDPVDSPWHTILVGSALDPVVETGLRRSENLTLRWENSQRDSTTDGFVRRIGLGAVDPAFEGCIDFSIPLPCKVGAFELLASSNPEMGSYSPSGPALLMEMGPSWDRLIPVFTWEGYPGLDPNFLKPMDEGAARKLSEMLSESQSMELCVRWRSMGETAWLLRSNALPRRTLNRGVHWEPSLIFRVRPPGTDGFVEEPYSLEELAESRSARRVLDLAEGRDFVVFDESVPGGFQPFSGDLVDFTVDVGSDVNGDGVADIALSLVGGTERVEIRSGKDGSTLLDLEGDPGDAFGHDLVFVPDQDGDGGADLLIGAPQGSDSASDAGGYLRLVSGRTGATLSELEGPSLRGSFGWSADFIEGLGPGGRGAIITSSLERGMAGWGSAKLLSLPGLEESAHFQGREQFDFFGNTCSRAGDVNGATIPDFLIGASCEEGPVWDAGGVYIYSGDASKGYPLIDHMRGPSIFGKMGGSVGPVGDVNQDGHADCFSSHRGLYTSVHSGKTGEVLFVFNGGAEHETHAGSAPRLSSDVDGDGINDLAVPRVISKTANGKSRILTTVIYSLGTGEPLLKLRHENAGKGFNVVGVPDMDGDGREDLLVGMGRRPGEERARLVFVLSSSF